MKLRRFEAGQPRLRELRSYYQWRRCQLARSYLPACLQGLIVPATPGNPQLVLHLSALLATLADPKVDTFALPPEEDHSDEA